MRAALPLLALTGCLYTAPVNQAPVARAEVHSELQLVHKGDIVRVSAAPSYDPDGHALDYFWDDDCQRLDDPATTPHRCPAVASSPRERTFTVATKEPFRIYLEVRDELGARSPREAVDIIPVNRAPEVQLQVTAEASPTGTYPLGRELILASQATDPDGDPVTWALGDTDGWQLEPPPASDPADLRFEPVTVTDPSLRRLVPDVPGVWTVQLTVWDSDGLPAIARRTLVVTGDEPPCIDATSPPATGAPIVVPRNDGPRRLAVESVRDDLDPYPYPIGTADPSVGETSFRWFVATPDTDGELSAVEGLDANELTIDPLLYLPGDLLEVRVEIADRTADWPSCPASDRTCGTVTCSQRQTWNLEVR